MSTTQTYKCISSYATIKSKPSLFAPNLGTLKKESLIEVISINGFWAYFKYNNKDAYILTNYIKKVQTVITGSITIRYLNTDTKSVILSPVTNSNLTLKSYTYTAPSIANYTVVDPSSKSVNLTATNPNQEVIFYYTENKIYGSITINYIDKDTGLSIAPSETHKNIELGTYSYNCIDITGYKLSGVSSQSVTLTKDTYNQTIIFEYNKILGAVYVKHLDVETKAEIATTESYYNLELKAYSYNAKSIDGYTVVEPSSKAITLTATDYNQTVVFYYKENKIYGSITIKYVDKTTNTSIAESKVYKDLELGTYSYDAIDILGYDVSGESSKSVILTTDNLNQTIIFNYVVEKAIEPLDPSKQNEVPYISTYYIKPIVKPDEEVIIDYYITDYYHKEYVKEDYSEIFTVTVRIEGKDDIVIKNLKAGDHSVSLGIFPKLDGQEQKFSMLCTDQYGRNSHELFNFFLVRNEVTVKEYIMTTQDLTTYSISNTNDTTKLVSTREGLQKLLDDKQAQGFNRLKLLAGTYRIDHLAPIYIPTKFTLDMNGATLKLHEFTGDKALMMELNNTFDSHVINGTIQGDKINHDYTNSPNSSEWVNGISMGNECKYSSYENLTIKDITGYGTINGIKNYRGTSVGYIYNAGHSGGNIKSFNLGDIDRITGLNLPSTNRTTCDFIDITGYRNIGYLSVSVYLGYQGNPCGTWNLICHFYDENKTFIKSTDAHLYRRVGVPSNARFVRITILNEAYPTNLDIILYRVPTHCWHKNLYLEECRAVGMAPQGMNNMLFEDCELTKCGSAVTKCALDAEDGWDTMQDTTFRRLNFHDNYYNGFLTCAGHNFILEYSTCGIYIWGRTRNIVIRNCNSDGRLHNDGIIRTGVPRFINNTSSGVVEFANSSDAIITNSLVRNCTFINNLLQNGLAYNCTFNNPNGFMKKTTLNNCLIKNISGYINEDMYFNDCIFYSDNNKISSLRFNTSTGYREFNNCTFKNTVSLAGNYFGKGLFNNCKFENVSMNLNSSNNLNDLIFDRCQLNYTSNNLINISSDIYVTFKNCKIVENPNISNKITSLVYLSKEPSSGKTTFENCIILKTSGSILDGYYNPGYINKNASYEVILNNSPVTIQLLSDKYKNSTLQLYKVLLIG